jgi:formimidoylglutamate deiminase
LEYSQRLLVRQRNVMAAGPHGATATALIQRTLAGGAQALGQPQAGLRPGASANFFTLAPDRLGPLAADHPDTALSTAIFAARAPVIDGVWVRGKQVVQDGRHKLAGPIRDRFHRVQAKLG